MPRAAMSPLSDTWLAEHRVSSAPITTSDVVAVGHAVAEISSLAQRFSRADGLTAIGAEIPRGFLFHGPPGTGETLCARLFSSLLAPDIPMYEVSADELTPELVRDLFRSLADRRCVLYLDEIDHVARSRDDFRHDPQSRQILIALLAGIDGIRPLHGPVVIASSSDPPARLDAALMRGGRLGIWVEFGLPEEVERIALLEYFAATRQFAGEMAWREVAVLTADASPADLRELLNDAAGIAWTHDRELPTQEDVEAAARRRGRVRGEPVLDSIARLRTAIHEAGHVAVAVGLLGEDRVLQVTLTGHGGYTHLAELGGPDYAFDLQQQAVVSFGGTIAEDLVWGLASEGARHDFHIVTDIALRLAAFGQLRDFPPVSVEKLETLSEELRRRLDRAVIAFAQEAHDKAFNLLYPQIKPLERFADLLVKADGSLHGQSLRDALKAAGFRRSDGSAKPPEPALR